MQALYKVVENTKIHYKSNVNTGTLKTNNLPFLIVDDDDVDRLHLVRWCKKNGYHFQIASNGLEAQDMLKKQSFGMVFTDIDMPKMDGIKLAQVLRSQEMQTNIHIPIVAVSGNEVLSIEKNIGKFGFDYFIPKPANSETLQYVIKKFYLG